MGWGRQWPERDPRPEVQKLSDDQKNKILSVLTKGIEESPVLTALFFRARLLRGRFYIETIWQDEKDQLDTQVVGRMTPLTGAKLSLLLETERSKNNWHEIARGSAETLIKTITDDRKGTFHGLGVLDKSIKQARKKGLDRLEIVRKEDLHFVYAETGIECSAQETLFHYFGVPIEVVAEPTEWYAYNRKPKIEEVSQDRTKILVSFTAFNLSFGSEFGGTCLYTVVDHEWQAFKIRPNQSGSIPEATVWLEKRKWKGW